MHYRNQNRWSCLKFAAISLVAAAITAGIAILFDEEGYFVGTVCCGWFGWVGVVAAISTFGWQMHVDVDGIHTRFLFGFIHYCERWDTLRSWRISKSVDAETKGVRWHVDFDFGGQWPTQIDAQMLDFQDFLDDIRIHVAALEDATSELWPPIDDASERPAGE